MDYANELKNMFGSASNNILVMCKDCAKKRLEHYQEHNKDRIYNEGDMVKIIIGNSEHIWSKVEEVLAGSLLVSLNNEPLDPDFYNGQFISIFISSIEVCLPVGEEESFDKILYEFYTFKTCGHD